MRGINKLGLLFAVFFLFALSGCSSLPKQQYNKEASGSIKKIALLKPKPREKYAVFYFNHPGMNFGLIGGLAAASEFSSKESSFQQAIRGIAFQPADDFIKQLEIKMQGRGYELITIDDDPSKLKEASFRTQYPPSDADAYLDTYFGVFGYLAGGPASEYKPSAFVAVRLVEKQRNTLLYAEEIRVGEGFGVREEHAYLGYDEKYIFRSFNELIAAPQKSIEGLSSVVDRVTTHIARALDRSPENADIAPVKTSLLAK